MSSYSASLLQKNLANKTTVGLGSFANICIDGRYSIETAKDFARDQLKKEAGNKYIGFVIEKTERFVDYRNPIIVDNDIATKDVVHLL